MQRRSGAEAEVVVITGASAGVGRAVARVFAERGASLGLIARNRERLEEACREMRAAGGRALSLPLDVADALAVEQAAEEVETVFGAITLWVNAAMVTIMAPCEQISTEEFQRVTEVTYLGTVHGTMAAYRRMLPRNHGVILQVGSALAYRSIPMQAPYCGAKAGIRGFTDSLRTELIHQGSRVHLCMVQLPAVNTPQFTWCRTKLPRPPRPIPPVFQPEVAARAIVWAADHRRRELHLGLSSAVTILANKIFPAALDRYLGRTGVDGQQTDGAMAADRPDNLYESPDSAVGARGEFDDEAHHGSIQFWLSKHRIALLVWTLLFLVGIGVVWQAL